MLESVSCLMLCWAGFYTPRISEWSRRDRLLTWDAVDAERAGRSEDASPKHSRVTGWFQAEVLETANFYWPLTSAGSLHWEPNFHWLMTQAGSRGQPRGMLNSHWPRRLHLLHTGFNNLLNVNLSLFHKRFGLCLDREDFTTIPVFIFLHRLEEAGRIKSLLH